MSPAPPTDRSGFEIALICALPLEADCVQAIFDRFWEDEGKDYGKLPGDLNSYTAGAIGEHNVVLAYMPGMGKVSAASVASSLGISFPNIKLAFVVGVCGGAPYNQDQEEILLGDVIISQALVQYDFGRQYPTAFERRDTLEDNLARPNPEIRSVLAKSQTHRYRKKLQDEIMLYFAQLQGELPAITHLGSTADRLYEPSYLHKHHKSGCEICQHATDRVCEAATKMSCTDLGCDETRLVQRQRLVVVPSVPQQRKPMLHFGKMGSGDTVMKSGEVRDKIVRDSGVIAFDMEGAGVWDSFPSVVVKGVCDYADSHKNKGWQKYAAAMAACCVKAFLKQWSPVAQNSPAASVTPVTYSIHQQKSDSSIDQLSETTSGLSALMLDNEQPEALWHVPFDNMQSFVGRKNEINTLRSRLLQQAGYSKMAVFGLGGVGKSRIAWEMASDARFRGYSVFWIQATSSSTFEKDYREIGEKLRIHGLDDKGSDTKELVKQQLTLQSVGRWLIILDNADDESLWACRASQGNTVLADYIPRCANGSVLITTRSRRVAVQLAGKAIVELQQMDAADAIDTLKSVLVEPDITTDAAATLDMIAKLSCLPLAIVQAAAYINVNNLSIREYLGLLDDANEENIVNLLSEDFEDETRYGKISNSVASTWLISFQQIIKSRPKSIDYLSYIACLNEKDIPRSLLLIASSEKEFVDAIGTLTGYSFIRKRMRDERGESDEDFYDIHRLVRLATRNWLRSQNTLEQWTSTAIERLSDNLPSSYLTNRKRWADYMPHAQAVCASAGNSDLPKLYALMTMMGKRLGYDGFYKEAFEYFSAAKNWNEKNRGPMDQMTLQSYSHLATTLLEFGQLTEAEIWGEKAVRGMRQQLGDRHIDTLMSMRTLFSIYATQGRLTEAAELGHIAIEASKLELGSDHQETLNITVRLAETYLRNGLWKEAEALFLESIEAEKKIYSADHPGRLTSYAPLAFVYLQLGRVEEAERLVTEDAEFKARVCGPEHPRTQFCKLILARVYMSQQRYGEAEELCLQILKVGEKMHGPGTSNLLESLHDLARIRLCQERLEEAATLYTELVERYVNHLGLRHIRTLVVMGDFAEVKWGLGHRQEAIDMITKTIELSAASYRAYRADHPTIVRWKQILKDFTDEQDVESPKDKSGNQSQDPAPDAPSTQSNEAPSSNTVP